MRSTDAYFTPDADQIKTVKVPIGQEIRFAPIGSGGSEYVLPTATPTVLGGVNMAPSATTAIVYDSKQVDDKLTNIPTETDVNNQIDQKITALNLAGTYSTKEEVTQAISTANDAKTLAEAAPTIEEVDDEIDTKIEDLHLNTTYVAITAFNNVKTLAEAAAPQATTYTKTEVDGQIDNKITALSLDTTYATQTALSEVKTTADNAAPQTTTYTKAEVDNTFATKESIPTTLPSPGVLTVKYNGTTAFTYDGSVAETGNFTVTPETIPASTDSGFSTLKEELDNKLSASNALVFSATNILECPADKKVADETAVGVINGGLIFKTTGEVYLGVNGAWVQLGVAIS